MQQPQPRDVKDRFLETEVQCMNCQKKYTPVDEVPGYDGPIPPFVVNNFCSPKCFAEANARKDEPVKFNLGKQFEFFKEKMQLQKMPQHQAREMFNAFAGALSQLVGMMKESPTPVDLPDLDAQLIAYWTAVLNRQKEKKNGSRIIKLPGSDLN